MYQIKKSNNVFYKIKLLSNTDLTYSFYVHIRDITTGKAISIFFTPNRIHTLAHYYRQVLFLSVLF